MIVPRPLQWNSVPGEYAMAAYICVLYSYLHTKRCLGRAGSISKRFRRRSPTAFVHGHDPFSYGFELPISTLVTRSQLCIDSSSVVAATVASSCFWSPSTFLTGTTTAVSSPPLHGLVFSVQAVTAREH
ncbi:hypothetical protein DY000_02037433 [Brassica cretica]|uniref:Uncharacterized protein n=1 Tax=Brassica cretica TaxID=69181 RepID=A0ABQ7BIN6_BRACR|nr:hypothetical protein DY000_02037433 [Brassica cretica]